MLKQRTPQQHTPIFTLFILLIIFIIFFVSVYLFSHYGVRQGWWEPHQPKPIFEININIETTCIEHGEKYCVRYQSKITN